MRLRQARSDIHDAERYEFSVAIDGNAAAQFVGSRQHAEIGERHECDGGACRQRQPFIGRKRRTCCRKLALPALRCAAGNRTRQKPVNEIRCQPPSGHQECLRYPDHVKKRTYAASGLCG